MTHNPVGAGLPAMVVNDNARRLTLLGALRFFASKLAPTRTALILLLRLSAQREYSHLATPVNEVMLEVKWYHY